MNLLHVIGMVFAVAVAVAAYAPSIGTEKTVYSKPK